ncbi:MAG: Endonuclease IV Nfo [Candidatus Methanohalarchaeum thermophilum]|uniref:Probable endonuclease 4 n=1 Tax=Methanohalarchaeum thermophilum TaxID=1903181 RepID=A0A1Q6DW03_METT1|nr:MAG: Endonuclease IV Nfo [Candidatus Methanohalarchaeum thermophilum]
MLRIGAHVSISGGFSKSIDRIEKLGGNCCQIFSHSPRGWKFDVPSKEEGRDFMDRRKGSDVDPIVIHESYLTNLATPKDDLYRKSMDAMEKEVETAKRLGIKYINIHPGTHTGLGEEKGLKKISDSLNKLKETEDIEILLEMTSGSGTTLGYNLDQIREIIENSKVPTAVTLDTCHVFSAGYDLATENGLDEFTNEFDAKIGLNKLKLIHLNDSKFPLGSNKDRHEHIGEGKIGEEGMKRIINHEKLRNLPFILETPEDDKKGHKENIKKVKELRKDN